MKFVLSISQDYWVYLDITLQSFKIWEFWGEFWGIETFYRSKFSPATGVIRPLPRMVCPGNPSERCDILRTTQSIMFVPLQVNRFQKRILLLVLYKYLKWFSGDFYSPQSDPPHKIMQYWFYYSIFLGFSFWTDHAGMRGWSQRGYRDSILETVRETPTFGYQEVPRWAQYTWHKKYSLSVRIGFRTDPIWAPSQLSVCSHSPTVHYTTISWFPYNCFRMRPLIFCQHTIHQVIWPSPGTLVTKQDLVLLHNTNSIECVYL